MIFGQKKKKKFQKIILNLKECINLIKFQKCWGIINTLFKCMSLDKMKNDISFKLDLLENDENEKTDDIEEERNKMNNNNQNIENINNTNLNYFNIQKVSTKNKSIREKQVNNILTRYKDRNYN